MKNNRGTENKFEVLNCHLNSQKCHHHLALINKSYALAHDLLLEKDYFNSINSLKYAYQVAKGIEEPSCKNCATFFRHTLTNSLEEISRELKELSNGWFVGKKYKPVYIECCNILTEFKRSSV